MVAWLLVLEPQVSTGEVVVLVALVGLAREVPRIYADTFPECNWAGVHVDDPHNMRGTFSHLQVRV